MDRLVVEPDDCLMARPPVYLTPDASSGGDPRATLRAKGGVKIEFFEHGIHTPMRMGIYTNY